MISNNNSSPQREAKAKRLLGKILAYVILIGMLLFVLIPFYIIFVTSFKTQSEAIAIPFTIFPKVFTLDGYETVLFNDASGGAMGVSTVLLGFWNTFRTVIPMTLLAIATSSFAAFCFAKLNFPCKRLFFTVLLASMMIPGIVTLMPSYLIYDMLYLTDTYFPLIVPTMFGTATCVFFLRQFFYGIPDSLIEAAKIDGMSLFGIHLKIMIPLSKSAFFAQAVLIFMGGYNDYFGPLLYLWSPEKYTLQIALNFFVGLYDKNYGTIMAGCIVSIVPLLALYLLCQRSFVEGIATSGMKL